MRQVIFCPFCGKRVELDEEVVDIARATQRLDGEELDDLKSHARRSDHAVTFDAAETLADAGWVKKHLHERQARIRRLVLAISIIGIILLMILAARD